MLLLGLSIKVLLIASLSVSAEDVITIGAIMSNPEYESLFHEAVANLTAPNGYKYESTSLLMGRNPVKTARDVCNQIIPKKVVAVIYQVEQTVEKYMTAVPYTLEYYKIPVLGISSRTSILSNDYVHPYFLRTVPPYSYEAELWYKMLSILKYSRVIFIYTSSVEGEATLSKFREVVIDNDAPYGEEKIQISKLVMLQTYEGNYTEKMEPILSDDSRVILLAADAEESAKVYSAAEQLGIVGSSWVWIVGEQAASVPTAPQGALSWQLVNETLSVENNLLDGLSLVSEAISDFLTTTSPSGLGEIPDSCALEVGSFFSSPFWKEGVSLYESMLGREIRDGHTGTIRFDESGDRNTVNLDLKNKQADGSWWKVGEFRAHEEKQRSVVDNDQVASNGVMNISEELIIWPGEQQEKPIGGKVSNHLRVVTIRETPFVYTEPFDPEKGCNDSQLHAENARMKCPQRYANGTEVMYCCYGYLIDMLDMLTLNMSVTFGLHLVHDGMYGSWFYNNVTGKSEWNGMMGELLAGDADMIVAPFTIDPERAKYVDFTKPFKFLGITILVKKTTKESSLTSFMQPFQQTLWILVVLSVHVIALVLYLLDRFSPFGQLQLARDSDSEDALSLSSAIWFSWGVLLNSGIGEGTPKSFSARVLGMVWAGFAMIIVASYTANLAAFLVLDRPEASISGIDDPRLRNPTENFKFATVENSAIEHYFKRQVEYTTMYRTMEKHNKHTVEDAIKAVEDESLNAFIWDSPRLTYEATKRCDLVTAGELFGRTSYGIGFAKNSIWTERFSLKLLGYHEVGRMELYDNKWIMQKATECEKDEASPATLGLTNMAGVFMMVAGGIVVGVVILLIEIAYNKYERMKERENYVAKKTIATWKRYVQRRKALKKTWAFIKDTNEQMTDEEERARLREYMTKSDSNLQKLSAADESVNGITVHVDHEPVNGNAVHAANPMRNVSSEKSLSGDTWELTPTGFPADNGIVKHNPLYEEDAC